MCFKICGDRIDIDLRADVVHCLCEPCDDLGDCRLSQQVQNAYADLHRGR